MDAERLHQEALVMDAAASVLCAPRRIDNGIDGVADDAVAVAEHEKRLSGRRWRRADDPSPNHDPGGIEMPENLSNPTAALVVRGVSEGDIRVVLGENGMRVVETCGGG